MRVVLTDKTVMRNCEL